MWSSNHLHDILKIYRTLFPTVTPLIQFLLTPNLNKWNNVLISSNLVSPSCKLSHIPSDRLIFQKQSWKKLIALGTNFSLICIALPDVNLPYLSNLSPITLPLNQFSNSHFKLLQMVSLFTPFSLTFNSCLPKFYIFF